MKKQRQKKSGKVGKIVKTVLSALACIILAVVVLAANTLLPTYGRMVTEVIGYKQAWSNPVEAKNLDLEYNKADYASVDELKAAQQALNEQITAEGMVLLKGDKDHLPYAQGTTFSLFSHSSVSYLAGGYMGATSP